MSRLLDGSLVSRLKSLTSSEVVYKLAQDHNFDITSKRFQELLDENDTLSHLRDEFIVPKLKTFPGVTVGASDTDECIYFSGNSLGLQPKKAREIVNKVLENWCTNGLECHMTGVLPSRYCDEHVVDAMAELVGACPDEIAMMNGLSVNLHFLLVSFYQPTPKRHKILLESRAFPSDHYVVESQIRQRGFDPAKSMLMVDTSADSDLWNMDDIVETINREGDSIAVVFLPAVHYLTGQVFDMERITKVAHERGCMVGFDLAHGVGNIPIHLHDWEVDFAAWCTYKYLNSGPGCMAGSYMHRKHANNDFPKFTGWWGHKDESRFDMDNRMDIVPGIRGYRISNPPPLLVACIQASMDIFQKTSMSKLCEKSFLLTGYLEALLRHYFASGKSKHSVEILTPAKERGCQLSLRFSCLFSEVHSALCEHGVSCDFREPDIMRVAPIPLYNTFLEVYKFVDILREVLG